MATPADFATWAAGAAPGDERIIQPSEVCESLWAAWKSGLLELERKGFGGALLVATRTRAKWPDREPAPTPIDPLAFRAPDRRPGRHSDGRM